MKSYPHDLAISAVPHDTILVGELFERLAPRLACAPFWAGNAEAETLEGASALLAGESRLALVLHQRLWQGNDVTSLDDGVLRERLARRPESVRVVTLDETALPDWLADVPHCSLGSIGLEGVVEFTVAAVHAAGGATIPADSELPATAEVRRGWGDGPLPYLSQPRAHSALRRELDGLATALKPWLKLETAKNEECIVELHSLPHRLIMRVDDACVSFSWVPGRLGSVSDGRLLVIQWTGLASETRGLAALRSATPGRERVYLAEADDASSWCWRSADPNGRAFSTAHLAVEWLEGAWTLQDRPSGVAPACATS
jgi:hypothetical protein